MARNSAAAALPKRIPDDLDRRLIAHLRRGGRASLSKLAPALGAACGTIQSRLARLMEAGTILGFTVRVQDDYDSDAVHAIMMIEITRSAAPGPAHLPAMDCSNDR